MKLTHGTLLTAVLALVLWTSGATAHDIRPGEAVLGEVAGAGAVEVLEMDLAAGDAIKIKVKAKGNGGCAPAIEVLDPDGDPVASGADERKIKLAFTAAETGTYQIRLSTDSASAARFKMKVRGEAGRKYDSRSGALAFGVRAGSRVDVKVKSKGASAFQLHDSSGDDVSAALSGGGRKIKARVNAAHETGDWDLTFGPETAKAKVKVAYPAPRADLMLTMVASAGGNGSYSPPAARQDDEEEETPEDPAAPQDPQDPVAGDGSVGQPADGTAGGANPDGTAGGGAPAIPADHGYLTTLLDEREDAELERVRFELRQSAPALVRDVAESLRAAVEDPIAESIHDMVFARFEAHETTDAAGIDALVDLVADRRRADRAQAMLDVLGQTIVGTALDGDPDFDAARSTVEADLATLNAAIAYALDGGAEAVVRAEADGAVPGRDAIEATNEMVAGMAAMDAAALSGPIMARARALEPAAIELAEALYAAYDAALAANPAADANPAATQAAIAAARAELAGLRHEAIGVELEIALESEPAPSAEGPYAIAVRVFGPESVEVEVEGDTAPDALIEMGEDGFLIHMPAHPEARELTVRVRSESADPAAGVDAGAEQSLTLYLDPEQPEMPAQDIEARAVDAEGSALIGASWEIRFPHEDRVATNAAGRPLVGETDEDGRMVAESVPEGEWILVIRTPEAEAAAPVLVENPDENPQDLGDIALQ